MSANHKRPFYVFAVVAAICSLVLVTSMRGKAESSPPAPEIAAPEISGVPALSETVNSAGVTIKRLAEAVDARVLDTKFGPLLAGTGAEHGPWSSGGTEPPESTPPSPEGTDSEPAGPGAGDIEGGQTPSAPDSPETDDVDDEDEVIETRPQGDEETQSNVGNDDPDADTDGEDPDGTDEEEPGPLDDTEDSDEGDGYSGEEQGEEQGDGQDVDGDRDVDQDQGEEVDQDLVEDLGAEVDPDVVPDVDRD